MYHVLNSDFQPFLLVELDMRKRKQKNRALIPPDAGGGGDFVPEPNDDQTDNATPLLKSQTHANIDVVINEGYPAESSDSVAFDKEDLEDVNLRGSAESV